MSDMSKADTRAKLIDPAIHARGWTEDLIKRDLLRPRPPCRRCRDANAIEQSEKALSALLKEGREATAKAEAIENAVYDQKAVNPNRKANVDTRTPDELLDLIEAKGREIADALALLRSMEART